MQALDDAGPFDVIGDVHGCIDELTVLLVQLGYEWRGDGASHPEGRRALFLGDLVNRGPDTPAVLRLVMGMADAGDALCLPGNHDVMLQRRLQGRDVKDAKAVESSLTQLERAPPGLAQAFVRFIEALAPYLLLDSGSLAVAHAGLPEEYQSADTEDARSFAIFGRDVPGPEGKPVRYDWARDYRGETRVVYGHTPQREPGWRNNTLCIDTGCVYGGRLTALRYPELELVSVPAARVYYERSKE